MDCTATEEYEGTTGRPHRRAFRVSVNSGTLPVDPVRDVLCWNSDEPRPKRIVGPFTAVSVGGEHTCARAPIRTLPVAENATARLRPGISSGPFTAVAREQATCAIRLAGGWLAPDHARS